MTTEPQLGLALTIIRKGNHFFEVTNKASGAVTHKWDWDALLKEVQIATGDRKVQYVDVGDLSPAEAVALVKEVEAKVTKTRAKKVSTVAKKDK